MAIVQMLGQSMAGRPSGSPYGLDNADWIALASFVVSVIALWVSIHFARRAEQATKSANDVAIGQAETNLRTAITNAHQWVQQSNIQIATVRKDRNPEELTSEERTIFDVLVTNYDEAAEQLLNAYEDACGKYIDNKIDKERFKQSYKKEIRRLCEKDRGTIHMLLHPQESSSFIAIWSVYEKWSGDE